MHLTSAGRTRGLIDPNTMYALGIFLLLLVLGGCSTFTYEKVDGNQYAIKETWGEGVAPQPLGPKTYWRNRWTTTFYPYDMSGQVFVMNDKPSETYGAGRRFDVLEVKSADNQRVHFHITMQWHRDFNKLVEMHKQYRDSVEERLIRPEVIRVMMAHATVRPAIELYSGQSLEDVRKAVEAELKRPDGAMGSSGVLVISFVIDKTDFPDTKYVENIEARQRAIIAESRAREEQKANLALAEAAKAAALKQQYEDVVKAETNKQVQILNQQAAAQQTTIKVDADAKNAIVTQEAESRKIVLAAEAEAKRNVAISEAQRQAELNRAVGIEAVGRAEAEAKKLGLLAYSGPGADTYAHIEVAKALAVAFSGVKGWLPQGVNYNLVGRDFDSAVNLLVAPTQVNPAQPSPAANPATTLIFSGK